MADRVPRGARSTIASRILLRDPPSSAPPLLVKPVHDFKHTGRYRVIGEIARGGIGVILKSHDEDLGRDVAMKVLREEHVKNDQVIERFVEEAQIGGQLQHPGIVPVYELGTGDDSRPFFTMKLVKGRTLSALLLDRKELASDRRRMISIFEAVCLTTAYAHSRGVIHRDLKPSNIMVGAFGEVQVVDWGLAKVLGQGGVADERRARDATTSIIMTVRSNDVGSQSIAGSVFGTPSYMPPEQAQGFVDRVDERGDVFALGAILCEILTGSPPYFPRHEGGPDVLEQAMRGDLADARARLAACGADAELVQLANDCLQPLPVDRPRSAQEVAPRVAAWITTVEERVREARVAAADARARVRGLLLLIAALGLVLIAGGGWWWIERQAAARRDSGSRSVRTELDRVVSMVAKARAAPPGAIGAWEPALAAARGAETLALTVETGADVRTRATELRTEVELDAELARKDAARDAKDRAMVERLQGLRGTEKDLGATTVEEFAATFRDYGIDVLTLPPAESVAAFRDSRILDVLANGLDYWAAIDPPRKSQLAEITAAADPDPWRTRLRSAQTDAQLDAVAGSANLATLPIASALELIYALGARDLVPAAVAIAEKVATAHPDDYSVHMSLAEMLDRIVPRRLDDALRHATTAIALRPGSAYAWSRSGLCFAFLKRLPEAVDAFRRAVEIRPQDPLVHLYLALTLSEMRRFADSRAECEKALALRHGWPEALLVLGDACTHLGDLDAAIAALREAVRRFGRNTAPAPAGDAVTATAALAFALLRAGELDAALAEAERAITLDPGERSAIAYVVRGVVRARRGDRDGGRAAIKEAIRLDPKEAEAWSELGEIELADARFADAIAACRESLRLASDSAIAHRNLGAALRANRELDGAIEELTIAARLAPADPVVAEQLALAQRDRGRLREALEAFRKSGASAELIADTERLLALEPKLLRILQEKSPPASARDALDLARLCAIRQLHAAAAGYYARAFAAEPALAEDLAAGNRHEAARAAVLAAGGPPESLDAAARAQLGSDALAWLRDDLVLRSEAIETGSDAEIRAAAASLKRWLAEPDFARVRDEAALAQLPAAERAEWSALWSEVRDRVEQARSK